MLPCESIILITKKRDVPRAPPRKRYERYSCHFALNEQKECSLDESLSDADYYFCLATHAKTLVSGIVEKRDVKSRTLL